MHLVITFQDIFDEEPKSLYEYLNGIDQENLLMVCSAFMNFHPTNSQYGHYVDFISMFFRKDNEKIANEIIDKLHLISAENTSKLTIANIPAMLMLFQFCFENIKNEQGLSDAETEVNVFKAILVINQQIVSLQGKATTSSAHLNGRQRLVASLMSSVLPYSDILNADYSEILAGQLIRAKIFFEFLESLPRSKKLLEEFCAYYECRDWETFLRSTLPTTFAVLQFQTKESFIDIAPTPGAHFEASCRFLEKLIVDDVSVFSDHDFKAIRSQPFYKVEKGVYRIICGTFVLELVNKATYFKLKEINDHLDQEKIHEFRSFYSFEFSEKRLLYKLLNYIVNGSYIYWSGDAIKKKFPKINAEPDSYIRTGSNTFLLESKDVFLEAGTKSSFDFSRYEAALKEKFYYSEDETGKKKKKAILQLINNIRRILKLELPFDTNYKPKSIHIYPIIVVYDRIFNTPGINIILNDWFQIELKRLSDEGIDTRNVKPLTLIDVDTLIYHQDILRDRKIKLKEILDLYHRHISFDSQKKFKDEDQFKRYAAKTLEPFSLFFRNLMIEKKIIRAPKMVTEIGISLVNKE